ncbi:helix-turn-helix domain-containing protein [Candidatus Woesearchaeota archaeon]|nr:helix-turn-helix domain-containing protein [Candidatus Woesearchaeota archaeon]
MEYEELRRLGWSENEIRVYIGVLELGSAKVDAISKRMPLPRTTIYGILKSLLEKGTVSYVIKSGVKYFTAIDPRRLVSIQEEKIGALKRILPQLEIIKQTVGEKPTIELYEGKSGVKTIFEDMLKAKQAICGYGNTQLMSDLLEHYVPNYVNRRIDEKIFFRLITELSDKSKLMRKEDKKALRETKFIEKLKETTNATYIYGNKVAIITLLKKEPIGILIENEEVQKSQKVIFEILWDAALKKG